MKRKSKTEINEIAEKTATGWICSYGLKNALRISFSIRKKLKREKQKRKEKQK